jgi:hypothetical protein
MQQVVPGVESARRAMREAAEEDAYWDARYAGFLTTHPDRFVAVRKTTGQVVAADEDLDRVIDQINGQGLTVHDVWVRFIAATPIHIAL